MGEPPCDTILTFTGKYEWSPQSTDLLTIGIAFFNKSLSCWFFFFLLTSVYSFIHSLWKFVFVLVFQVFPSNMTKERRFNCINTDVSQTLKDTRLDLYFWVSLELSSFMLLEYFCPANKEKLPKALLPSTLPEPLATVKGVLMPFNGSFNDVAEPAQDLTQDLTLGTRRSRGGDCAFSAPQWNQRPALWGLGAGCSDRLGIRVVSFCCSALLSFCKFCLQWLDKFSPVTQSIKRRDYSQPSPSTMASEITFFKIISYSFSYLSISPCNKKNPWRSCH